MIDIRVYFKPDGRDEVEVTDNILLKSNMVISKSIDSVDYNIGSYVFDDLELIGDNREGFFNINDCRSVFIEDRNRTIVRIEVNGYELFNGLLNEEATKINFTSGLIRLLALSLDSIFLRTGIRSEILEKGDSIKTALLKIFTHANVQQFLNIDPVEIQPEINLELDTIEKAKRLSVKEFLDIILFASNSIIWIEKGIVKIKGRSFVRKNKEIKHSFSEDDILEIADYNLGYHRIFNWFKINDSIVKDDASIERYGLKKKEFNIDFFTNADKEKTIGTRLISEFAFPQEELKIKVPLNINVNPLDIIFIKIEPKFEIAKGNFAPTVGVTKVGDRFSPIPKFYNFLSIDKDETFLVLAVEHNLTDLKTIIKLRKI